MVGDISVIPKYNVAEEFLELIVVDHIKERVPIEDFVGHNEDGFPLDKSV